MHISEFHDFQQSVLLAQKIPGLTSRTQDSSASYSAEGMKITDCIQLRNETFSNFNSKTKDPVKTKPYNYNVAMNKEHTRHLKNTLYKPKNGLKSAEDCIQMKNTTCGTSAGNDTTTKLSTKVTEMCMDRKMYRGDSEFMPHMPESVNNFAIAVTSTFSLNHTNNNKSSLSNERKSKPISQTLHFSNEEEEEEDVPLKSLISHQPINCTNFKAENSCFTTTTNNPSRLSVEGEVYEIYEIDSSSSEPDTSELQTELPDLHSTEDYDVYISKWRSILECFVCFKTFPKFSLLFQHFQVQHPNATCQIICCKGLLNDRFEIVQHISHHINIKSFSCDKCYKIYKNTNSLNYHRKMIHFGGRPPIKCPNCESVFTRRFHLKRHLKNSCHIIDNKSSTDSNQQQHACQKCGKSFTLRKNLFRHMKTIHYRSNQHYRCDICNKRYISKIDLSRHMAVHTGEH